jgi:Ca-activated chloride channel family protein
MMRWGHPELFWVLAVPVAAVFLWVYGAAVRRTLRARAGAAPLVQKLLATFSPQRRLVKQFLVGTALLLIALAALRPQFGRRPEALRQSGIDVAIAFDISKSMLARDVAPSRLQAARELLLRLVTTLQGDRVALVPFAGVAFTQSPLTADNSAIRLYLDSLDPQKMPVGGTNLAMAITQATQLLTGPADKAENAGRSRVILLLTDGEDVAPGAGDAAKKAARKAAEQGIALYAIGIGTMTGEPIPLVDANGNHAGYQKGTDGKPIYSKLNLTLLEELARLSDPQNAAKPHVFAHDGSTDVAAQLASTLGELQKTTLEASVRHQFGEKFQYVLLPGILFLLAEMLISERRRRRTVVSGAGARP